MRVYLGLMTIFLVSFMMNCSETKSKIDKSQGSKLDLAQKNIDNFAEPQLDFDKSELFAREALINSQFPVGSNEFAFDLFKLLAEDKSNIAFSPSVFLPPWP